MDPMNLLKDIIFACVFIQVNNLKYFRNVQEPSYNFYTAGGCIRMTKLKSMTNEKKHNG